jgi:hypothetical protein
MPPEKLNPTMSGHISQVPMKPRTLLFLALPSLLAATARSATLGTWSASGGADPGTDGWTLSTTGNGGSYQGNSGSNGDGSGAGAGNPAWAFWANGGGLSAGVWNLDGGALTVGQELGIDFDNGWIESGGQVGIEFRQGNTVGLSVFYSNGQSAYQVFQNGGVVGSGVGFTDDGFNISVLMTGANTFNLDFSSYSQSGTLGNGATAIDNIRFFNSNAGGGGERDAFVNNLTVVPEPATALLGSLGLLALLRRRK